MYNLPTPSKAKDETLVYHQYKGVDFSVDETLLSREYTQKAENLFVNESGVMQTRWGSQVLYNFDPYPNGLFGSMVGGVPRLFVVYGGSIYEMTGEDFSTPVEININISQTGKISTCVYGDAVWILDGVNFWRMTFEEEGTIVKNLSEIAYVPTTSIAAEPDGTGRIDFESENLLSSGRINTFRGDGSSKSYRLDGSDLSAKAVSVVVDGVELDSNRYTVQRDVGYIHFTTAPGEPENIGEDNVSISYYLSDTSSAEKIHSCTLMGTYGLGEDVRVFFSGNPAHASTDWYCGYKDPTYVPKSSESKLGNGEGTVLGYLESAGQQVIVMGGHSNGETSLYLRTATVDDSGLPLFLVETGITGYDGVASGCVGFYGGEGYYLSTKGLYSLSSSTITEEKTLKSRSLRINNLLLAAPSKPDHKELEDYEMVAFGEYLLITNGEELFVGDGRFSSGELQWYIWSDIGARQITLLDGRVYWIDNYATLRQFNHDLSVPQRFANGIYPSITRFQTIADDDDYPSYRKQFASKGLYLECKSFGVALTVTITYDGTTSEVHTIPADTPDDGGNYLVRTLFIPVSARGYHRASIAITNPSGVGGFELYRLIKTFGVIGRRI